MPTEINLNDKKSMNSISPNVNDKTMHGHKISEMSNIGSNFGNISFNTDSRFPTSMDMNSDEKDKDKETAQEYDKIRIINHEDNNSGKNSI
jgi:hypothetical protein